MKRSIMSSASLLLSGIASTAIIAIASATAGTIVSAAPASAQTRPTNPVPNNRSGGSGNFINYPAGSRFYSNGSIYVPRGGSLVTPSVTVPRGNGSTTYYYPNGTSITTRENTTNSTGVFLVPGTLNGGVRNSSSTRSAIPSTVVPNMLNSGQRSH